MANQPKRFGVVLYPGHQLNVCRPVDVINVVSSHIPGIQLSMIAESTSSVSTSPQCWQCLAMLAMPAFTTAQHLVLTFEDARVRRPHHPPRNGLFRPRPTGPTKPHHRRPDCQIHPV